MRRRPARAPSLHGPNREPVSRFVAAPDGLRLHFREYGAPSGSALPVVCLPGLARTAGDFDRLARELSRDGRRVLALDYRGRGLSDRDSDPRNYELGVEMSDTLAVLAAAGVEAAIFVGTSRGGLITMILAALRPEVILGAVLNDIGPVLEPEGLTRIRGYVGKLPRPSSWTEAVTILKSVAARSFTALSEADWLAFAQLTFREENGVFETNYDPALTETLKALDITNLPTLWPQFEALSSVPVLVVRGGNSDLLSVATASEMMQRHPDCALYTVRDQGHAPFLTDEPTIARIREFVGHCESRAGPSGPPSQA